MFDSGDNCVCPADSMLFNGTTCECQENQVFNGVDTCDCIGDLVKNYENGTCGCPGNQIQDGVNCECPDKLVLIGDNCGNLEFHQMEKIFANKIVLCTSVMIEVFLATLKSLINGHAVYLVG